MLPGGAAFAAAWNSATVFPGESACTVSAKLSRSSRAIGVRLRQLNREPSRLRSTWATGVAKRLSRVMRIVWGSPALSTRKMNACAPAPAARFTGMKGCGESLCLSISGAMKRACWSAPPPVPAGVVNSTGRRGGKGGGPLGGPARGRGGGKGGCPGGRQDGAEECTPHPRQGDEPKQFETHPPHLRHWNGLPPCTHLAQSLIVESRSHEYVNKKPAHRNDCGERALSVTGCHAGSALRRPRPAPSGSQSRWRRG